MSTSSGYQPGDNETSSISDSMSGTADPSQFEREQSDASFSARMAAARQTARDRYQQLQQGATECVAKHPGKSMAAMAIAGVAVGLLLGRRNTRD